MGPGELKSDANTSSLCYSTSLNLAQTQSKKRKFYGENKERPASKVARSTEKQVFLMEGMPGSKEIEDQTSRTNRLPKA